MADLSLSTTWVGPDQARRNLHEVVAPFCKNMWAAGHRLAVDVRLYEDAKTDRQRAYYHGVVLKTIADQARPNDQSFPLAVWKEHFRAEFLGFKTVTTKNPLTGKTLRRRQRISTEDLGVRAYAKLIDRVIAFAAAELGIVVPIPYTEWERMQVDPETGEILGMVVGEPA